MLNILKIQVFYEVGFSGMGALQWNVLLIVTLKAVGRWGWLRLSELGSFSDHCLVSPVSASSRPITLPVIQALVSSQNNVLNKNPQDYGIKSRGHCVTISSRLQMVIDLFILSAERIYPMLADTKSHQERTTYEAEMSPS